jgi:hypothetical protein
MSGGAAEGLRMNSWQDGERANQMRARQRNEWIEAMKDRWESDSGATSIYACECNAGECVSTIVLTRAEYEGVRASGTRFVIATNHENPELDHVIVESNRFAVIEKLPGETAWAAREADPRRTPFSSSGS